MPAPAGADKKRLVFGAIFAGLLGLAVLATVILKMQTKDGVLVVEVNQPDAIVQVDEGKIEISRPGETGSISIAVDQGKHRLKVEKQGFQFYAQDFVMESGGKMEIKATLEPLKTEAGAGPPSKPWNTPAFQQWMKHVATLPAEEQADAVAKKLQELNPGFDGKETHAIEGNVVTELEFATDSVTNLSPVRALTRLKSLKCASNIWDASKRVGTLSDLSPLKGMALTTLDVRCTKRLRAFAAARG